MYSYGMLDIDPYTPVISQIQRILRLSAHPGSAHRPGKTLPTPSQYARYCNCTSQQLSRFANGDTKSLRHEVIDDLGVLMGLYPFAEEEERHWRIRMADHWLGRSDLRVKYERVNAYVLWRLRIRRALEYLRTIEKTGSEQATAITETSDGLLSPPE